ncbi:uncharacterized protein LOC119272445 [Triticum dicoccoides]|uniref:uncharacterized protein LOC119272445 n=1 Tax=Triticum dicoccoides TaxID=85692 RepID=UPI0018904BCB|nr:uncharacterized protein LOC119272445 [Triticum dicoccoides]
MSKNLTFPSTIKPAHLLEPHQLAVSFSRTRSLSPLLPQHLCSSSLPIGNAGSSGRPNLPPPRPHQHGVPPPYYHQYPPWRPGAAAPPPVPFPTHVERHRAVAVSAGVNVKGHTLWLERDDDGGHLLAFSFDADAPGRSTRRRCSWRVELEREVALLRTKLEAAQLRAEAAEEAEERLCMQLREAKCETLELAHVYQGHVQELTAARSR